MSPASDKKNTPGDQGVGPAHDMHQDSAVVRSVEKAVDELKTARGYIERDIDRGREDVRELREQGHRDMLDVSVRLRALETKVADLPTKTWIGVAVVGGMTVLSGLVAVLAKVLGH